MMSFLSEPLIGFQICAISADRNRPEPERFHASAERIAVRQEVFMVAHSRPPLPVG